MVSTATQPDPRVRAGRVAAAIVFFGTPAFAVPSLDALLGASPHTVVGVVTQPDRPRGRGQKLSDAPVKARAVDAGLPLLQPERMKDPDFSRRLRHGAPTSASSPHTAASSPTRFSRRRASG